MNQKEKDKLWEEFKGYFAPFISNESALLDNYLWWMHKLSEQEARHQEELHKAIYVSDENGIRKIECEGCNNLKRLEENISEKMRTDDMLDNYDIAFNNGLSQALNIIRSFKSE